MARKPVEIPMKMPSGKKSSITVHYREDGGVDIHLMRSSEGECLLMLPKHAADALGVALAPGSPS